MHKNFSTIGLVVRNDVYPHLATIRQVTSLLENQAEILIHSLDSDTSIAGFSNVTMEELTHQSDLVISLGGDGTLLSAARALVDTSIPLLGINLGRLGFLADVSIKDFEWHLGEVLAGNYTVEERFFIQGSFYEEDELISNYIALNDIIIHSHKTLSMIEYELYSNGALIQKQRADGVIVATPTGSTAYAMSGGGPILHPSLETLAIVPICPHTLSNRPVVLPADQKIEICLSQPDTIANVNFDGHHKETLGNTSKIEISRYPKPLSLLHPQNYNYFEVLREKLYWSTYY